MLNLIPGDALSCLKDIPSESVDCCITSPPYWGLRDYGMVGQLGLEKTPEEYVSKLVDVFREVHRVLKNEGTLWVNLGDSYAGSWGNQGRKETRGTQRTINKKMIQDVHDGRYPDLKSKTGSLDRTPGLKPKDLIGMPWKVAFALQADGWYLRQDIIWHKPNPMPESVKDRCTKAHEYIFLFSKSEQYYFDYEAIKEPATYAHEAKWDNGLNGHGGGKSHAGQQSSTRKFSADPTKRNRRSVWTVTTKPFKGAHFATYPPDLIEPCVLAGCPAGGIVLDPFLGSGTTLYVASQHNRKGIGIELNPSYLQMAMERLSVVPQKLF